MSNSALQPNFDFFFSTVFSYYQKKFDFWVKSGHKAVIVCSFLDFPDLSYIPKILSSNSFGNS